MVAVRCKNNRTRMWTKNGKPPVRYGTVYYYVEEDMQFALCEDCSRPFRVKDGAFQRRHRAAQYLICDSNPDKGTIMVVPKGRYSLNQMIELLKQGEL